MKQNQILKQILIKTFHYLNLQKKMWNIVCYWFVMIHNELRSLKSDDIQFIFCLKCIILKITTKNFEKNVLG